MAGASALLEQGWTRLGWPNARMRGLEPMIVRDLDEACALCCMPSSVSVSTLQVIAYLSLRGCPGGR